MRRRRIVLGCAAALGLGPAGRSRASTWPAQPLRWVVPDTPGSVLDLVSRAISGRLASRLKMQVVIDNQPGRGGLDGIAKVAKATDGHTLGLAGSGPLALASLLYPRPPYDAVRELRPVVPVCTQSLVLAVNAARAPVGTVAEFVAWAKARPVRLEFASDGAGGIGHLAMASLLGEIGAQGTHRPFDDATGAGRALVRGEVDGAWLPSSVLIVGQRSGQVRALALSSATRDESLPSVAPLSAAGFAGFDAPAWTGLVVATATPDPALKRINAELASLLQDANVRLVMELKGLVPLGGAAADLQRLVDADRKRWAPVISRLGLRLDATAATKETR